MPQANESVDVGRLHLLSDNLLETHEVCLGLCCQSVRKSVFRQKPVALRAKMQTQCRFTLNLCAKIRPKVIICFVVILSNFIAITTGKRYITTYHHRSEERLNGGGTRVVPDHHVSIGAQLNSHNELRRGSSSSQSSQEVYAFTLCFNNFQSFI